MTRTSLSRVVRDPRSGEVHVPHEPVTIVSTMRNLDRILLKLQWQSGGNCMVFPDDVKDIPLFSATD